MPDIGAFGGKEFYFIDEETRGQFKRQQGITSK
jgi:hypothetical protein